MRARSGESRQSSKLNTLLARLKLLPLPADLQQLPFGIRPQTWADFVLTAMTLTSLLGNPIQSFDFYNGLAANMQHYGIQNVAPYIFALAAAHTGELPNW